MNLDLIQPVPAGIPFQEMRLDWVTANNICLKAALAVRSYPQGERKGSNSKM